MKERGFTIIGPGAVGKALMKFFMAQRYQIKTVWDRNKIYHYLDNEKRDVIKKNEISISEDDLGSFIFITVPDDQIKPISMELADLDVNWKGRSVIHSSGNLTSDECIALKNQGAMVASMHPIQTFTQGDGADRFIDIFVSLEGDESLTLLLSELIYSMGANPVTLDAYQKRKLHLASVFACNYLIALLGQSEKLLNESNIDEGLHLLKPLILRTLENLFTKGVQKSLTGPISRGDIESVQKQMVMIEDDSSLSLLYKLLGLEALKITEKRGILSSDVMDELAKILAVEN